MCWRFIQKPELHHHLTIGHRQKMKALSIAVFFLLVFNILLVVPFIISRCSSFKSTSIEFDPQLSNLRRSNRPPIPLDHQDPNTSTTNDGPIHVIFWWETRKTSKKVDHSLARIMHAAVKSAIVAGIPHQTLDDYASATAAPGSNGSTLPFATVVVFSNTLPLDFFCAGAPAHTYRSAIEEKHTQQLTCKHVRVQKYNTNDLLNEHFDPSIAVPILQYLDNNHDTTTNHHHHTKQIELLPNDMSDVMRYILIYVFGSTYMDLDQLMLRPLPPQGPLLVQERQWSQKKCLVKKTANGYCTYIGSDAIPLTCIDPKFNKDYVFSLFSGVMGNFPPRSNLARKLVGELATSLGQTCALGWGCYGPLLTTRVVSHWCQEHRNTAPAYILPNSQYLLQHWEWKSKTKYNPTTWRKERVAVLDIDFHGKKSNTGMTAGLIDRMLWWNVDGTHAKDVTRSMHDLDEMEYAAYVESIASMTTTLITTTTTTLPNIDTSNFVAKLPWE